MEIEVNDHNFNGTKVPMEISLFQWLRLKLTGRVHVFEAIKAGWLGSLPFYVFRCETCGEYALDYPHGYSGYFSCPVCDAEPVRVKVEAESEGERLEVAV